MNIYKKTQNISNLEKTPHEIVKFYGISNNNEKYKMCMKNFVIQNDNSIFVSKKDFEISV